MPEETNPITIVADGYVTKAPAPAESTTTKQGEK